MSKKDMIEQLRHRLASNDRWALRALLRIYQNQTADEQCRETTIERNGIGFTGPDAEIMTSLRPSVSAARMPQPQADDHPAPPHAGLCAADRAMHRHHPT
jgi:hypothetical protein